MFSSDGSHFRPKHESDAISIATAQPTFDKQSTTGIGDFLDYSASAGQNRLFQVE
jgi:hypothetical protein